MRSWAQMDSFALAAACMRGRGFPPAVNAEIRLEEINPPRRPTKKLRSLPEESFVTRLCKPLCANRARALTGHNLRLYTPPLFDSRGECALL